MSNGKYTIYVHDALFPQGGSNAQILGTLATRDGCAVLEQEGSDIVHLVIWPSGTSIASEDPLTLELPSGKELAVGQTVIGGGGYFDASSGVVKVDLPAKCVRETGRVAVFNADDDPVVVE